jgi:hypothetical protein
MKCGAAIANERFDEIELMLYRDDIVDRRPTHQDESKPPGGEHCDCIGGKLTLCRTLISRRGVNTDEHHKCALTCATS